MKGLILNINYTVTFLLTAVVGVCLAFSVEGNSPLPEWFAYAAWMLAAEVCGYVLYGIIKVFAYLSAPRTVRRGYVRFCGNRWVCEDGRVFR